MQDEHNKSLGTLLIIGSAIAYSLFGYFTRLIMLDIWTVLFWRGIFGGLFIGTYLAWRCRQDLWEAIRAIGMPGFRGQRRLTLWAVKRLA